MDACASIDQWQDTLIGSFQPIGNLSDFYDGTSAEGNWVLEICDDAQGQIGIVKYFSLQFTNTICSAPSDIFFQDIEDQSFGLIIPPSDCDSLEIQYTDVANGIVEKLYVPCTGDTILIGDLNASSEYLLTYAAMCSGSLVSSSCPKEVETRCEASTSYTDFDDMETCQNTCSSACPITGDWHNINESAPWIINAGPTGTAQTGPEQDYFGAGQYIFIESSDTSCNNTEAILLSSCMNILDGSTCNISFAYHMFGNDISYLALDISTDNMNQWENIWMLTGNQGNQWNTASIDLSSYSNQNAQLRFRSFIPENNFGDVALDEIVLSSVEINTNTAWTIYLDEDGDQFGKSGTAITYCGNNIPPGYSLNDLDCNDQDPSINPDAPESPCNIIDDNCNGEIDEEMDGSDLSYQIIHVQDQNCTGVPDGSIHIEATGGIGPYSYTWMDGFEGNVRENLTSGTYQAIIEDQGNCQLLTDTFFIETLQNFDFFISSVTPATCLGIDDGKINITHDQSNAPYTYQWSSGDTTQNITDKGVGQYQLNITDVNGCIIETDSVYLMPASSIEIHIDSLHPIACYSENTAYIELSTSNETGPVQYIWDDLSEEPYRDQLSAGLYTVIIEDSIGCQVEGQFEITEPDLLEVKISLNDPVICYGDNNGFLQADIQGGTQPYDIQWSTGDTMVQLEDLSAGFYAITVQDHNGCQDIMDSIEIVQPDSLTLNIEQIEPALCSNNNSGSIELKAFGGNGNYQYLWSDQKDHENLAVNLSAGNYTVTMTDAFDCKISLEEISVPFVDVPLSYNITETSSIDCYGDSTGSIALELLQSTSGPHYFVFNGDSLLTENIYYHHEDLPAGSYDIIIYDGNGCHTDSIEIDIEQSDEINLVPSIIEDVGCYGDSTGYIEMDISGGMPPYSIQWNNQADSSLNEGLKAGMYSIYITDALDCRDSLINIEITQPEELLVLNAESTDLLCFGDSTGSISIELNNGGTAPYFYISEAWQDSSNAVHQHLADGMYQVIITDNNDCLVDSLHFEIHAPEPLEIQLDSIHKSICDGENGAIYLAALGGTGDILFDWDGYSGDGAYAQSLSAGTYAVTIEDENGCLDSLQEISIENIDLEIDLSIDFVDSVKCHDGSNGIIASSILGDAIPPYQFYLNDNLYQSGNSNELFASDLEAGTYNLHIIDGNNCRDTVPEIHIEEPPAIQYALHVLDSIQCYRDTNAIITIEASGGNGTLEFLWNNSAQGDTIYNLGEGIYTCAIIDEKNCIQFTDTITLVQPDSLYILANIQDATEDLNNGGIYLETFGGTQPYIYVWDPYLPTEVDTIEGLSESTWQLTLIDKNGCSLDTNFVINRIVNTSIEQIEHLRLYPTITSDYLILESDRPMSHWTIYDDTGRLIQTSTTTGLAAQSIQISVEHLASGLYFIEINQDGQAWTRPFIRR